MRRLRFVALLAFILALPAPFRDARACPVIVRSIWETIGEASWFGVLHARCESVPIPEEVRAGWFRSGDLDFDDEDVDPSDAPERVVEIVEWKVIRTISGAAAGVPDPATSGWGCEIEGWQEPSVVGFEEDGSTIPTPLSMEPPAARALDAHLDWVRQAVKARSKHGDRLADRHRLEWIVDGIVDPTTRRIALKELDASGWWPTAGPESLPSPLGALEKDRILRAFVRHPDVEGTLSLMLGLLRGEPSLLADLAAMEAMDAAFARWEAEPERVPFWGATWELTAVLERLGIADAGMRVHAATRSDGIQRTAALRELWSTARCESGYAARVECEPQPASAQSDPAQP
jgi:hypothetical protein